MKIYALIKRYKENAEHWLYSIKKGDVRNIQEHKVDFCCDEMKTEWFYLFGFGEKHSMDLNENKSVNIYYPVFDGDDFDLIPINFCPFCGEKIEIEIREEGGKPGNKTGKKIFTSSWNASQHQELHSDEFPAILQRGGIDHND